MRPDQHKKKKNLQYKKKHGIPTKKKESNERQDHVNKKPEPYANEGQGNSPNGSDSEEVETVSKPSYRRGKLASNWDRYAPLPPEDEDDVKPQQIGVDFASLLSQTADSLSQFRFKDEKEWDDEKSFNSTFVALNCEKLSESLQCIPLHQRLAIPDSLFTPDQIAEFVAAAAAEKVKYVPDCGSTILQESLPVFSHKTVESILTSEFRVPETGGEKWLISPRANSDSMPNNKSRNQTEMEGTGAMKNDYSQPLTMEKFATDLNSPAKQAKDEEKHVNSPPAKQPKEEKHYVSEATSSLENWLDSVLDDV
ncbi:cell death regulator Aven-like [Argonauta hians]